MTDPDHSSRTPHHKQAQHGPARPHRRRHQTSTARPGRGPADRRADAAIPGTVWDCSRWPVESAARFPTSILERITNSFSTPGDQVILLATNQTTPAASPASPRLLAVERELQAAAAAVEQHDRRCHIVRHPVLAAPASTAALSARPTAGQTVREANLLVTTVHPDEVIDGRIASAWARLLHPAGILAVLTHTDHHHGRLVDATGQIVASAQDAGLRYLQHIVALQVLIRHGTLAPCRPRQCRRNGHSRVRRHVRVHADVLIFTQPGRSAATGHRGK